MSMKYLEFSHLIKALNGFFETKVISYTFNAFLIFSIYFQMW